MLTSAITYLALNTISIYLVSELLDGFIVSGGIWGYVLVGVIVGLLNVFVKPILKVITLPFIFLTLGFFLIVINALILWLTEFLVETLSISGITFQVSGVATYFVAVIVLGLLNYLFQKLFR